MKLKAKIDAGVPARRWIQPLADKDNKKVWPKAPNGTPLHGGPQIVKGELYEIPDDKWGKGLAEIFEQVGKKDEK